MDPPRLVVASNHRQPFSAYNPYDQPSSSRSTGGNHGLHGGPTGTLERSPGTKGAGSKGSRSSSSSEELHAGSTGGQSTEMIGWDCEESGRRQSPSLVHVRDVYPPEISRWVIHHVRTVSRFCRRASRVGFKGERTCTTHASDFLAHSGEASFALIRRSVARETTPVSRMLDP